MGTGGRQEAQRERDGDDLDPLPPLDGDGTDGPEAPVRADDDLATGEEDNGGLDDSTPASDGQNAEVDAAELDDASAPERGWIDEPGDNQALDIGGYDLVHGTQERAEEKPVGTGDHARALDEADDHPAPDDDFAAGERADALDPTAEDGPVDADEDLRDEDLPSLDADEQDTGLAAREDAALLDERLAHGETNDPVGVPWSSAPWAGVGAPVGLRSVTALACVARGALVAWRPEGRGSTLLLVDLEGTSQTVRADGIGSGVVRRIAARGTVVALVVENAGLFLSRNAADRFEAFGVDVGVARIALGPDRVWAATLEGGLVSIEIAPPIVPLPAAAIVRHEVPGKVRALGEDGAGGIVALAVDAAERPTALVWGAPGGSIRWEGIELPLPPAGTDRAGAGEVGFEPLLAARGAFAALALGGDVFRRGAGGAWQHAAWDGTVTAITFVDDEGTLLAATYAQADAATALVSLDASGRPSVVALVGAAPDDPDSDGRALALAGDDAHGVVWLAGAFGVAAFARPSKV